MVAEDPRPAERLLGVDEVRVILRSVPQQLLHQEGVLRHSLDGLEEVEGEGHALDLGVSLTLPQQVVKLRPDLDKLLQQGLVSIIIIIIIINIIIIIINITIIINIIIKIIIIKIIIIVKNIIISSA